MSHHNPATLQSLENLFAAQATMTSKEKIRRRVENFKANRYDVFEQTIGRKYEEEGKYYFSSDICTKIDCFTKELYDFYEEGDEIKDKDHCFDYIVSVIYQIKGSRLLHLKFKFLYLSAR